MKKNKPKIKVLGIGGSGCNAVTRMSRYSIPGVDLVAINADVQDLKSAQAETKIQIGQKSTQGLGTGMDSKLGKTAAQENQEEISSLLSGSDMVFITYGMGGGTGTGAGPVVAKIAKSVGALTIAIVTKPFDFEGVQRKIIANRGLKALKPKVDTLLVIPNDRLLELEKENISLTKSFRFCDEILRSAVKGISDLIVRPGIINLDFADLKSVMEDSGGAVFGMGKAEGANRAKEAAYQAINSPLLDVSVQGAKGVLFNVSARKGLSLSEVRNAADIICKDINSKAKVIFGAVRDRSLKKRELKVTLIATGF